MAMISSGVGVTSPPPLHAPATNADVQQAEDDPILLRDATIYGPAWERGYHHRQPLAPERKDVWTLHVPSSIGGSEAASAGHSRIAWHVRITAGGPLSLSQNTARPISVFAASSRAFAASNSVAISSPMEYISSSV